MKKILIAAGIILVIYLVFFYKKAAATYTAPQPDQNQDPQPDHKQEGTFVISEPTVRRRPVPKPIINNDLANGSIAPAPPAES